MDKTPQLKPTNHAIAGHLRMARAFFHLTITIIALCLCTGLSAIADDDPIPEYRIRAAFIYNFLKFVRWPDTHSPVPAGAANVCIIGDNTFAEYLGTLQGTTQGITINVNSLVRESNMASCHVLIIGRGEEGHVASILAHIRHYPILSISETRNFADNGGIVEIVRVGKSVGLFSQDTINLRINIKPAESSGILIDARLLQIAAEVIK